MPGLPEAGGAAGWQLPQETIKKLSAISDQLKSKDPKRRLMKDFKKQKVWQKSHHLALDIYKVTGSFPREELYGLISQLRRSCVAIPANIAEGWGRKSEADFSRFLQIAMG
jgi:hypothetical protein